MSVPHRNTQSMLQVPLHFSDRTRQPEGVSRRILLDGGDLEYRFVRARRKTIGIIVRRGEVQARAPRYVTIAEVESFIREKQRWIARRLEEATRGPRPVQWIEGGTLPILGHSASLTGVTEMCGKDTVLLADGRLHLPVTQQHRWKEIVTDWLRTKALATFRQRVEHFTSLLGIGMPAVGLSNARTQWGSCRRLRGSNGRILLHWRLIQMPPHITDYVVVHEVAHLRELNHSARFWALVGRLYPDYLAVRRELNRLGRALPPL